MIDFACKKFKLNEIIKCSLDLTKFEFEIFEYLIRNDEKWFTTSELSKSLKIGLSTVQKAVKKLKQSNVVEPSQKNLEKGGYVFAYSIKNKTLLMEIILDLIHNWTKKVEVEIKRW